MTKAHGWRYWLVLLVGLCFSHMGLAQSQGNESEDERWFTADTLNAGLGEVPEEVKRLSPREAIRSFLTLTEEGDYAAAAHLLNLARLHVRSRRPRYAERQAVVGVEVCPREG